MVTLKEYEAYLKVKRFINGHDEAEIISRLMGDNKYIPLIIKSDDADPIKYYSTSAAATAYPQVRQKSFRKRILITSNQKAVMRWK